MKPTITLNSLLLLILLLFAPSAAAQPAQEAPAPSQPAKHVSSVFCDNYLPLPGLDINQNWDGSTTVSIQSMNNNYYLKYANLIYQPLAWDGAVDASEMTHLHLDIWAENKQNLTIDLNYWAADGTSTIKSITLTDSIKPGQWATLNIPLDKFGQFNFANINAFTFQGTGQTIYLDNLFFYKVLTTDEEEIDHLSGQLSFGDNGIFEETDPKATLTITNPQAASAYNLVVEVMDKTFSNLQTFTLNNVQIAQGTNIYTIPLTGLNPGFYHCKAYINSESAGLRIDKIRQFGYEPTEIPVSMTDKPTAFDSFWENALAELATVDPDYQMTELPGEGGGTHNVYEVSMKSVGGATIKGYYTEPISGTNYPAVIISMGFGAPALKTKYPNIATFCYNIRSMGISPSITEIGQNYLTYGIENASTYYYRNAYLDAIRALDFISSRPGIDSGKLIAQGGSQGAALTIAMAALDNRVKGIVAAVPFLSNFPVTQDIKSSSLSTNPWPINQIFQHTLTSAQKTQRETTLSYVDAKNMATRVTCPTRSVVALEDNVCPPYAVFTTYNNIAASDKSYFCFPNEGHVVPQSKLDELTMELLEIEPASDKPTVSAPEPLHNEADVISLFSESYTAVCQLQFPSFDEWKTTEVEEYSINNNDKCLEFKIFNYQSIFDATWSLIHIQDMTHLHMDIWTEEAYSAGIKIDLTDGSSSEVSPFTTLASQWNPIDVKLEDILSPIPESIAALMLQDGDGSSSIFIDNIYFYKKSTSQSTKAAWTGAMDNDWNNPGNWSNSSVPDALTDVYIPADATIFPFLTEPKNNNICRNIYFMFGAELGRPDLLTYEKAHVQLNFGLEDTLNPQQHSTRMEEHLPYSAAKSATPLTRNKWHMLSIPLKKTVTGDFSFGGYPGTFLRKFEASKPVSGTHIKGNWSNYYNTTIAEFQAGEGFILWMNEYKPESGKDFMVYKEYNKGIDAPISSEEREYGIQQINGILEIPYYEDEDMSRAHRLHRYYPESGRTSFNGISGNKTGNDYLQMTTAMEWFHRGESDEAYRFIFEDTAGYPDVKLPVKASVKESDENSMLALAGNPYMCSIDFDKFYETNKLYIKPCYHIWTETAFSTYNVTTGSNSGVKSLNQYIPPMQSFLVELNDEVDEAELIFDLAAISTETAGTRQKSRASDTQNNKITITATNNAGSVKTFIAKELSSLYRSQMEGGKIISSLRAIPEIYTIRQSGNDMTGTAYSIIGNESIEVPLALASTQSGTVNFIITGMNSYDSNILFIDRYENINVDITGRESFSYEFNYTPLLNVQNSIIPDEERFSIRFSTLNTTGVEINYEDNIKVYSSGGNIKVISSFDNPINEVCLYDVQGRMIYANNEINTSLHNIITENMPAMCIIKVITKKATKNHIIKIK